MTKHISIVCTWIATSMMLLSTVVMHHHHYERICVALEICSHYGNEGIEAEAEDTHTHQETDRGSCRVHQLHKFITNAGVAKSIRHHICDLQLFTTSALPDRTMLPPACAYTIAAWQHKATPLSLRVLPSMSRRGPPVF